MNAKSMRCQDRGFTLLEVMVALAVAAIGLGAISKSLTSNVDITDRLKQRTLATWVASNRLAELRMNRQFFASGGQTGEAEMGGQSWRIEEKYGATADPNISSVEVQVLEPDGKDVIASLSGYLSRYKPDKTGS
ncbi:MAG: type II secretion system minor pseudopilin GspI [Acidiferrobacterales bacterium]|nr:type II secretion system minor pseudopilin GspI [Acidiferrobacterales bacterium]